MRSSEKAFSKSHVPAHGDAARVQFVQRADQVANDTDVLAETQLVGRVAAEGMVEVTVEPEGEVDVRHYS